MGINLLEVSLQQLRLKTPLMTASGTSGHGNEMERLKECAATLDALGAFVTKGVTLEPRQGNPEIRVVETRAGILNSIGLQNSGAQKFMEKSLPDLLHFNLPVIVNISASSVEEFGQLAAFFMEHDVQQKIAGLEINVSCPNLCEGGMAFGTNPRFVEEIVKTVRQNVRAGMVVITKLTPNVTDITLPARAAIQGGTDALSMINTLRGIAIDIETRKPFLGNVYGGLSGPAIKPVGLYMVYECFNKIAECRDQRIPIIGIGGITTWQDAVEYLLAGATAIGIGTAWFVNAGVFGEIKAGLEAFLQSKKTTASELIGKAHSG
jgi:dihydroorotate dehydrogenase (NAD+) catalytic subunit